MISRSYCIKKTLANGQDDPFGKSILTVCPILFNSQAKYQSDLSVPPYLVMGSLVLCTISMFILFL
jgi:hypothetical protein